MSLSTEHIGVVYREADHSIQALEDVSLNIEPGTCLALVGESGSGKTTLGKACLGLLPKNALQRGRILVDGEEINFADEEEINRVRWKKLAMVFQDGIVNLNPVHRIIDQVAEPVIQHEGASRKEASDRAASFLEKIGLSGEHHHRYPHQLSGGQVQRVLLAMAMILDPSVLILDEPTSALDAHTKGIVARIITESKNKGKTLLLITHDLEFAASTADVMVVLYLGQIMEKLPATDLLFNPLHPYTLALGRSYPAMDTARDLGGIRGDAFYRIVHQHGHEDLARYGHTHIQVPQSVHQDGHPAPIGCLFQERCTQAVEDCGKEAVSLQEIDNHEVRCLRRGIVDRIELKGVSKTYGKVTALQPLDLTVKAGELLALVGETGSGKTTLAMVAAGVIKPDQGVRRLDGWDMDRWMKADAKSLAGRIGVVYQNPAESISHRFSVYEAVAEPLKIHRIRGNKEAQKASVKAVLANVRLSTDEAFLNRYSHELNMGALQRVCMARALVLGPQVLVADEPTSALDPSVQAKVLKLLLELQIERGLTMLFVSHDLGLARKISDRIGVMLKGQFAELGPASLILAKPAHPYTRMLIDSVGGHWRENDGKTSDNIPLSGCPFALRCPGRKMICDAENPHLRLIDRRYVACHFPYNPN